jgi:hypothetical protein
MVRGAGITQERVANAAHRNVEAVKSQFQRQRYSPAVLEAARRLLGEMP